ncbi:TetR/AcrR family transcriptional regulator [Acidisphaera sp. L21]|uniref:TetR/AcrR family transcriptional regulator n=1 Tax=Acidisphaera sp. L21 TaxID=1641851 RepID=UPI001C205374|nr:TetR/AcrR family transcriptional regulator [Acidisphaera sp. L21]
MSKAQAAENRERIVAAATRLFREHGFDGVGIDALMQSEGMTHGGFYRNFASKDALAAEACGRTMALAEANWAKMIERGGGEARTVIATHYLSARHRDEPGDGCGFSAFAVDAGRRRGPVAAAFAKGLRAVIGQLSHIMSGRAADARREKAIAAMSGLVGALILARAVDDPAFSDEILQAGKRAFAGDTN